MKPIVEKYSDTEWEFIYPKEIDNEKTYAEYEKALDCLDYDDLKAEKIFKALIKKHPYYLDAYNHLSIAFKNINKRFESYLTAEKSYRIGKECFPKTFKTGRDQLIWGNLDNRPFLRACHVFALECQDAGEFDKAIKLYDEMLALNPNDNQGGRYLKLECLFANSDFKGAKKLLTQFADDWSIDFAYGKVAIAIIGSNLNSAKQLLEDAISINRFLPLEVKKLRHTSPPPYRIPGEPDFDAGSPVGSIQQSYDYWERNKALYKRKDIIDFYKSISIK